MKAVAGICLAVLMGWSGTARAAELFEHNGSLLIFDYQAGIISYEQVTASVRAGVSTCL